MSSTLLSSNPETASIYILFANNLDDPSDPDGVHPLQIYLGHPENVKVGERHMTDDDSFSSERGRKLGPQIIPSLSIVPL
jgi:hypothetical protein